MGSTHLYAIIAGCIIASTSALSGLGCSAAGDGSSSYDIRAGSGGAGLEGSFGAGGAGADSHASGGCPSVSAAAESHIQPSDIIVAIDQSGSMDEETDWVKDQLPGFAQQIANSGIDVHVVLIAGRPGNGDNGFCAPAPLGSGDCPNDDNLPMFLHIDAHVSSHNALAAILGQYDNYQQQLRHDASKHIVVITDDDSDIGAAAFDSALKALDPSFDPYVFHAIACEDDDSPCADKGKVYWALVSMTGGVFGELSDQDFQPIWNQLSQQVITGASLACEWDIPEPPDDQQFDRDMVNARYAVNGGPSQPLGYVGSLAECAAFTDGWYYDNPNAPLRIGVCPDVCQVIQSADSAEVHIEFGCETVAAAPH